MLWMIFFLSFIPALFWIAFFYYSDKYEREPFRLILWTFLLGCISVIPAVVIEVFLQGRVEFFIPFSPLRILIMMLIVGFAEETVKYLAIYKGGYVQNEFNEPMDGIVYAVSAAIGFAFIENIGYMLQYHYTVGEFGAYSVGIMRAVFSMFGHASFAVILGSYLGRAKFTPDKEVTLVVKGIVLASLIHALYNFVLQVNRHALGGVLVLLSFIIMWRNLNRVQIDAAEDVSPFKPPEDDFRPVRWEWGVANVLSLIMIIYVIIFAIDSFNKPIVFTNDQMKYLLEHPSFWGKRINRDSSVVELLGPPFHDNVPIVRIKTKKSYFIKDLKKTATEEISSLSISEMRHLKKISLRETLIDSFPAIIIKTSWTRHDRDNNLVSMMSYVAVIRNNERTVFIRCDSKEDQFYALEGCFTGIIKSFKYLKEKEE